MSLDSYNSSEVDHNPGLGHLVDIGYTAEISEIFHCLCRQGEITTSDPSRYL
jgi:hypothetical protein